MGNPNDRDATRGALTSSGLIEHTLNAKDCGDLILLANALNGLPATAHPAIAARVLAEGLMLPKGIGARVMTLASKIVQWRRKVDAYTAYATLLCTTHGRSIATDTFDQTVKWIVYGRDTSTKGSAGGFNQTEVDKLCRMHNLAALTPSALSGDAGERE